jgi:hypothetical protein
MSTLTQKLLGYLNRVFDKNPYQQLALRLQYDGSDMTWAISNSVLTTTVTGGTGVNLTVDLTAYTISTLATFLAAQTGYSIPFVDTSAFGERGAQVLFEQSGDIDLSNGDHIYGYTNLLWAYLETNAVQLTAASTAITNALLQMNTITAEDDWLDFQGGYYDVPRLQGELDSLYSPRITATVIAPRGNNVAIATAITAIAVGAEQVRVIDAIDDIAFSIIYDGLIEFNGAEFFDAGLGVSGAYGFFDVDFSYDFSGSVTQSTYFSQIVTTVAAFRDAGTQLRIIIFRNNGSVNFIISDSFVDGIRVIVYNDFTTADYRLLENGLIRLLENGVDARILES